VSSFRRACRWLHRELGFLAVGLTLAYAISGVAVNHIDSWNPNYSEIVTTGRIAPTTAADPDSVAAHVLAELALTEPVKNVWRAGPDQFRVILADATIDVTLSTGAVLRKRLEARPFLHDVNFLHLNHAKGAWTWIADGYALVLATLALTGIFLLKGRRGLAGRGGVMLAAGFALPVLYLVFAKYL
jgi:hypothetical protein